jgi:PAC2 family
VDELTMMQEASPRRPVLLVAYHGYFDVAMVATQATDAIAGHESAVVSASIDCDRFYDFTDQRPTVSIADGGVRQVVWPDHHFRRIRVADAPRDLLVLTAPEPHLAWARYARLMVELAQRTGVELLVTLGAVPDRVPHSRAPLVFGSTTTPGLAARLGLSKPQYQGLTGIVGVLHDAFDRAGIAAVALRAPVAHYLAGAPHPRAVLSLVGHVQHVTGVPLAHVRLDDEIDEWQHRHDEAVAENPEAAGYVRMLEAEHDRRIERSIPTGDHLADQFEQFLRDKDAE